MDGGDSPHSSSAKIKLIGSVVEEKKYVCRSPSVWTSKVEEDYETTLVVYNLKVWITNGEHTEFIIPLVTTSQNIQV